MPLAQMIPRKELLLVPCIFYLFKLRFIEYMEEWAHYAFLLGLHI